MNYLAKASVSQCVLFRCGQYGKRPWAKAHLFANAFRGPEGRRFHLFALRAWARRECAKFLLVSPSYFGDEADEGWTKSRGDAGTAGNCAGRPGMLSASGAQKIRLLGWRIGVGCGLRGDKLWIDEKYCDFWALAPRF